MTMASLLFPENPSRIHSYMKGSSFMLKIATIWASFSRTQEEPLSLLFSHFLYSESRPPDTFTYNQNIHVH